VASAQPTLTSTTEHANTAAPLGYHRLEDYAPLIGPEAVDRILGKVARLPAVHIENVSSTYYGGGVSEILSPLTLLLNNAGLQTGWRVLQGTPGFFAFTKEIHNGLHGAAVELTPEKIRLFEEVVFENAARMHLDGHDFIIVHDPQPLPMVQHHRGTYGAIWQCHVDLTCPNVELWRYLSGFVERFDTAVVSLPEYAQPLSVPQRFIIPAINPFSIKNRPMSDDEVRSCLARYSIPRGVPLVVQASRFDKWKDPQGVVEAFRIARKEVDCVLVLVGNRADDDPEGQQIYEAIYKSMDEGIIVVLAEDAALVNALQRSATVVLQKSIREGFGLTVAEAMWKGACVIGGNVGGIRHQITDGVDGFLVNSVAQTAERIVQLLKDQALRERLGRRARATATERFLMSRLAEDWIDLIGSMLANTPHSCESRS
jgi:trehalose synthase